MTSLTIAVRYLHLTASILALGIFVFLMFVGRPALRGAAAAAHARFARFEQNQWRLLGAALAVIFVTGVAGFVLQAAVMTGRPVSQIVTADTVSAVFGTQYGRVWAAREALLLLLAGVYALLVRRRRTARGLQYAGLALAAALLGAWVGASHAAAGEGATLFLQLASDVLHVLAVGAWTGALLPLALLLSSWRRSELAWAGTVIRECAWRFSWLGMICVTTLILAGTINAWNLVNGAAPLVGTTYGRLLLLKLGLLVPILIFAAMNLLRVRPRLLATPPRGAKFRGLLAALRRNTLAEAGLAAAILMIVAILGVTPPARHVQPEWPFAFRLSWDVTKTVHEKRTQAVLGAGIALLAFIPFGYVLAKRRRERWPWAAGAAIAVGGAAIALPALWIDAYPTTYRRPAVPYQAISVASGAHLYRQNCVGCHGVAGFGDGPVGATLKPKPADLTAKHTGDHTAGDLFWWLTHGKDQTAMPGFENVLSEEARWDLINFLRALSAAEQARPMAPLLERPWLAAPDFLYQTLRGDNKSLKEHRGQNVVLLALFTLPESQRRLEQLGRWQARLADAGVEVLAVPRDVRGARGRLQTAAFPVVTDGAEETFETYGMFRRSLSEDGMRPDAPLPPHMEFLIDRQGYIRARWIAAENIGWGNADILFEEIARLNREKPALPAPDDHVH